MLFLRFVLIAVAALHTLPPAGAAALFDSPTALLILRVFDPSGAPIAGARVTLHSRDSQARFTAVTDTAGVVRFETLRSGRYLVEADAHGFARPDPRELRLDGGTHELSVTMRLSGVEQRVIVTASDTAQQPGEVSKAAGLIDRSNLEARAAVSLTDALRDAAGVRVEQFGGPGSFSSVRIRGLRAQDTAVLIDGVRFRDAAATQGDATGFVSDLLVANLDRVEILRGSGSSLYGSHAVGGVVNLITRSGGGPPHGSILLEGGSLSLSRVRGLLAGGLKKDRLTYSVGFGRLNVGEGVDGDDRAWNSSVQGRTDFRLGTGSLAVRIHAADAFTALNESPVGIGLLPPAGIVAATPLSGSELRRYQTGEPVSDLRIGKANFIPSANDPDSSRASSFLSLLLLFEQRPAARFAYTLSYHRVATSRSFRDGPLGISGFEPNGAARSEFGGLIDTFAARGDLQLGRHQLVTAAYQFERERYLNDLFPANPAANATVDITEYSHSISIHDQARLLRGSLQLSGAVRAQVFSLSNPGFTPAATAPYLGVRFARPPAAYTADGSVAYAVRLTQTRFRVHVGSGYRAPSLFERFGTSFGSRGYSVFGDPRLEPERSLAVDAGVDQQLGARASISLGLFSTRLGRVIIFDSSGAITPETDPFRRSRGYRTVDGGTARGLELVSSAQPFKCMRLNASYTHTNAEPPARDPLDPPQAFAIPRHQFSLTLLQEVARRVQTSLELIAFGSYLAPIPDRATFVSRTYRFAGMRRADLGISYLSPMLKEVGLRLFVKLDNLTGRTYFESGFRTPGRSVRAGAAVEF